MKVIYADQRRRLVMPQAVKPDSAWVPILISKNEILLRAYRPRFETVRAASRPLATASELPVKGDVEVALGWDAWR